MYILKVLTLKINMLAHSVLELYYGILLLILQISMRQINWSNFSARWSYYDLLNQRQIAYYVSRPLLQPVPGCKTIIDPLLEKCPIRAIVHRRLLHLPI